MNTTLALLLSSTILSAPFSPATTPGDHFATLEHAFKTADRMRIEELPSLESMDRWSCIGVNKGDDKLLEGKIPFRATVTVPAGYFKPAGGPLFPGIPAQNESRESIFIAEKGAQPSAGDLLEYYGLFQPTVRVSPDLGATMSLPKSKNDHTKVGSADLTFRMRDGLIFVHQAISCLDDPSDQFCPRWRPDSYAYCWQE